MDSLKIEIFFQKFRYVKRNKIFILHSPYVFHSLSVWKESLVSNYYNRC